MAKLLPDPRDTDEEGNKVGWKYKKADYMWIKN